MDEIENIIAERSYVFKYKDTGKIINSSILIGAPYKSEYGFSCPFIVTGFEDSRVRTVHGEDTLEALTTAYEILNTFIRIYERDGQFGFNEKSYIEQERILPRNLWALGEN